MKILLTSGNDIFANKIVNFLTNLTTKNDIEFTHIKNDSLKSELSIKIEYADAPKKIASILVKTLFGSVFGKK